MVQRHAGLWLIILDQLVSLHCYSTWVCKHLKRNEYWPVCLFLQVCPWLYGWHSFWMPGISKPFFLWLSRYCCSTTLDEGYTGKDFHKYSAFPQAHQVECSPWTFVTASHDSFRAEGEVTISPTPDDSCLLLTRFVLTQVFIYFSLSLPPPSPPLMCF